MLDFNWTMVMVCIVVIQLIFSIYSHCVIKFNDFAHVTKDMQEIKGKQDAHTTKLSEISDRVSYLEGRSNVRTARKAKSKGIDIKRKR